MKNPFHHHLFDLKKNNIDLFLKVSASLKGRSFAKKELFVSHKCAL